MSLLNVRTNSLNCTQMPDDNHSREFRWTNFNADVLDGQTIWNVCYFWTSSKLQMVFQGSYTHSKFQSQGILLQPMITLAYKPPSTMVK